MDFLLIPTALATSSRVRPRSARHCSSSSGKSSFGVFRCVAIYMVYNSGKKSLSRALCGPYARCGYPVEIKKVPLNLYVRPEVKQAVKKYADKEDRNPSNLSDRLLGWCVK